MLDNAKSSRLHVSKSEQEETWPKKKYDEVDDVCLDDMLRNFEVDSLIHTRRRSNAYCCML